jgi:DNA polymerase III delta prime subunit
MSKNIWYEKYRPSKIEDIYISKQKLDSIKKWFEDYQSGNTTQCSLLFIGPPGVGKTSLARIILKHYGYKIKEFNASDIRSKSHIVSCLNDLVNMKGIYSLNPIKTKTSIIMDEVDGMFKGDSGGIDCLLSFISIPSTRKKIKTVVNLNRKIPFICISNTGNIKKDTLNKLKKESFTLEFGLPTQNDVKMLMEKILKQENMTIDPEAKELVLKFCQLDFRKLTCLLEFLYNMYKHEVITYKNMTYCFDSMTLKDKDLYVTDSIHDMLNKNVDCFRIQSIYDSDKSKVPMIIHQNYAHAVSSQKTSNSIKLSNSLKIIDSLIISDEIEKMMYNRQCWGLPSIQSITCSHIPNYYINKHPKLNYISAKWATILSTNSQAQRLYINVNSEINRMSKRKSYNTTDLQHVIEIIFHCLINGDTEKAIESIYNYNLCEELSKTKKNKVKALNIINKLGKYIKISPYYIKWSDFYSKNKNNRDLEDKIYSHYEYLVNRSFNMCQQKIAPSKPSKPSKPQATDAEKHSTSRKIKLRKPIEVSEKSSQKIVRKIRLKPQTKVTELNFKDQKQIVSKRPTITLKLKK